MNVISHNIWMLVVVLIITTFTQNINAKDDKIKEISVIEKSSAKICGTDDEKEFIIAIDMGEVFLTDSLYGFNFELRYDSTKIRITDYLVVGTLAENCSYKGCAFLHDTVRAYAANMDFTALKGKKPLMAFKGKALGDCADSALIILEYVEFTDEFIYKNIQYKNLELKIGKKSYPNNKIEINILEDTISLDKSDESLQLKIPIEIYSSYAVKNLKLEINGKDANSIFNLIDSTYSFADFKITNLENSLHLDVDFNNKVNYKNFDLYFNLKTKFITDADINFLENYNINIIENKCECIDNYNSDNLILSYKKSEIVSVKENIDINTYFISNRLYLDNFKEYKDLKIYNSLGQMVLSRNIDNLNYIDLSTDIDDGIYFAILINQDKVNSINDKSFIKQIKILKYSFIN